MPRLARAPRWMLLLALGCSGGGGGGEPSAEPLPNFLWSGTGAGVDFAAAVAVYADGSSVVAGHMENVLTLEGVDLPVDLDEGAGALLLSRFHADGTLAWARTDGADSRVNARGAAALPDGSCVVTGTFVGAATFGIGDAAQTSFTSRGGTDVFVAKYSLDGELVWARQAGGSAVGDPSRGVISDLVEAVDAFADGSCVIAGEFSTGLVLGEGANEVTLAGGSGFSSFVARYAADGTLQWAHQVRNTSGAYTNVAARPDGSCVAVGLTPLEGLSLRLSGFELLREVDGWTWMAAIDAGGEVLWVRAEGRDAQVVPWDLAVAADGSFVLAGEILGPAAGLNGSPTILTPPLEGRRAFLARFDASGSAMWARKDDCDVHNAVAVRPDGAPVVAGSFFGTGGLGETSFDRGMEWGSFLARFGADGALAAARVEGGPGLNLFTFPATLRVFADGRLALAASFQGDVRIAEDTPEERTLTGRGGWEFLFAVYDADAGFSNAR